MPVTPGNSPARGAAKAGARAKAVPLLIETCGSGWSTFRGLLLPPGQAVSVAGTAAEVAEAVTRALAPASGEGAPAEVVLAICDPSAQRGVFATDDLETTRLLRLPMGDRLARLRGRGEELRYALEAELPIEIDRYATGFSEPDRWSGLGGLGELWRELRAMRSPAADAGEAAAISTTAFGVALVAAPWRALVDALEGKTPDNTGEAATEVEIEAEAPTRTAGTVSVAAVAPAAVLVAVEQWAARSPKSAASPAPTGLRASRGLAVLMRDPAAALPGRGGAPAGLCLVICNGSGDVAAWIDLSATCATPRDMVHLRHWGAAGASLRILEGVPAEVVARAEASGFESVGTNAGAASAGSTAPQLAELRSAAASGAVALDLLPSLRNSARGSASGVAGDASEGPGSAISILASLHSSPLARAAALGMAAALALVIAASGFQGLRYQSAARETDFWVDDQYRLAVGDPLAEAPAWVPLALESELAGGAGEGAAGEGAVLERLEALVRSIGVLRHELPAPPTLRRLREAPAARTLTVQRVEIGEDGLRLAARSLSYADAERLGTALTRLLSRPFSIPRSSRVAEFGLGGDSVGGLSFNLMERSATR